MALAETGRYSIVGRVEGGGAEKCHAWREEFLLSPGTLGDYLRMTSRLFPLLPLLCCVPFCLAEPEGRKVPPPGIPVPDATRAELTAGAASLNQQIAELRKSLTGNPRLLALLPDV